MSKEKKDVSAELNDLRNSAKESKESSDNSLLQFFLGVILLGLGLFMLSKRVMVHSSWYTWGFGGFRLSSGLVTVPLIIGIIWKFYNPKSIVAKVLIVLGVIFIVATIIMSLRISFMATSLYEYIIIIGMAAAGSGLLLRTLFKKRN